MTHETSFGSIEAKDIAVKSNWLLFRRNLLRAKEIKPWQLGGILDVGATAIVSSLDKFYENQQQKNPDSEIHYPWLQTIQLCELGEEPGILTENGLEPPYREISKTVHEDIGDIITRLRPYWEIARDQFDVRALSHLEGWAGHEGTWMQIRPRGKN